MHTTAVRVRSCRQESNNASKQTRTSEAFPRTLTLTLSQVYFSPQDALFFVVVRFFQIPRTLKGQPRDGPPSRLQVLLFLVWNIGVFDVPKTEPSACFHFNHILTRSAQGTYPIFFFHTTRQTIRLPTGGGRYLTLSPRDTVPSP